MFGQDDVFLRIDIIQQIFFGSIRDIDSPHRHCHDIGAGRLDRFFGLDEIFVFSGSDPQAGLEFPVPAIIKSVVDPYRIG